MSNLKDHIEHDMKSAMKAQDKPRLLTIRMLRSAIKQKEIDERIELDDKQVIQVIEKLIKQRRDSIKFFEEGGRTEQAAQERFEIEVLSTYLPEPLDESTIVAMIDKVIGATQADSMKDMGKVMGLLKPELAGKADLSKVSAWVKERLTQ